MRALLCLFVLTSPLLCAAEVVVPIDSVEEHVNIRLSPDAKSEIIGRLEQGDSAQLVESSDGWHEVEIVGGSTGFISADWTNVLSQVPTPVEEIAATVAEPAENGASTAQAEDVAVAEPKTATRVVQVQQH